MRRLHEIIEDQKAKTGRAQDFRIAYEHIASGGLRPRAHDIAPSVKAFGKISFHNYADYAMGAGFQFGFTRLRELGSVRRSAIRPMIQRTWSEIPYATEQGIISKEQGILAQETGILLAKTEIVAG